MAAANVGKYLTLVLPRYDAPGRCAAAAPPWVGGGELAALCARAAGGGAVASGPAVCARAAGRAAPAAVREALCAGADSAAPGDCWAATGGLGRDPRGVRAFKSRFAPNLRKAVARLMIGEAGFDTAAPGRFRVRERACDARQVERHADWDDGARATLCAGALRGRGADVAACATSRALRGAAPSHVAGACCGRGGREPADCFRVAAAAGLGHGAAAAACAAAADAAPAACLRSLAKRRRGPGDEDRAAAFCRGADAAARACSGDARGPVRRSNPTP